MSHPLDETCPINRRSFGSGDRIVIYTDGLVDDPSRGGILRAMSETKATLDRHARRTAPDLADALFRNPTDAKPRDDVLLMVIAIK